MDLSRLKVVISVIPKRLFSVQTLFVLLGGSVATF